MAPLAANTGRSASAAKSVGALLSWMAYSKLPIFCVPAGVSRFWAASALATSLADRPRDCMAAGSRSIWIWRNLPPNGNGMAAPGTVTSGVRTVLIAMSNTACSDMPLPASASWMIGTVEALKFRISGGVMLGGICFSTVCEIAVTCALAVRMSVPGWKKTLTMPTPV